jgi:hypothetical protein
MKQMFVFLVEVWRVLLCFLCSFYLPILCFIDSFDTGTRLSHSLLFFIILSPEFRLLFVTSVTGVAT